jgi:hypothetical protein
MLGSSWVAAQLAASQEGLGPKSEWVRVMRYTYAFIIVLCNCLLRIGAGHSLQIQKYVLLTHSLTHSLTHGAEPFLRSCQLCSYSRTSQHFMEPQGSLSCSREPSTGPYLEYVLLWKVNGHWGIFESSLTSPTSGGRSVCIVRLRTKSHGIFK